MELEELRLCTLLSELPLLKKDAFHSPTESANSSARKVEVKLQPRDGGSIPGSGL